LTRRLLLAAGLWLAATPGWAAETPNVGRPDPADPAAPTLPVSYESAFEGYQPFRDVTRIPWKDTNRTVGQVGGHAGALKDEPPGDAPPAAPAAENETPKASPLTPVSAHGAHHGG
jgi:hypothetical protein